MRITEVETIPVRVPLKGGMTTKTAHGEHVESPYVIVRIHTDSGLIGLGEATVSPRWSGETGPGCRAIIDGLLAPAIAGEDPRNINALRRRIDALVRLNPFAKAAVDMALWDLAGKAAGLPLYQLLGGKVRDSLRVKLVIGAFSPSRAAELAREFLDRGATCLKVKVGIDPEQDLERVRAVREVAGPHVSLGVDANCGWTTSEAARMLARLREFNLLFVEQPISTADPCELAALRRHSEIPIMADESVFTLNDAWHLTCHRAADLFSVYPGKHGGIQPTLAIVSVAQAAGIRCSMGSNLELGIATAAMLHVGAAVASIDSETYPGDFIGPLYHESDLLQRPLQLGPPAATIPDGPGLGVELDDQQLERYRDPSGQARPLGAVNVRVGNQ